MSYILDALKKAEQERQQGRVPDLMTVQVSTEAAPKRRGLRKRAIFILLFVAVLLSVSWVYFFKQETKQPVVTDKTAAPKIQEMSDIMPSPASSPPEKKQSLTYSVKIEASNKDTRPSERPKESDVDMKVIQERSVTGPIVSPTEKRTETRDHPIPKQAIVQNMDPAPKKTEKAALTPEASRVSVDRPAKVAQVTAEPPAMPDRIYKLKELPESIRSGLPEFSISAFLYGVSPASRMVRINERMLKEGQELSPGIRLQEITPDGLIFLHKGYKFTIAMEQQGK